MATVISQEQVGVVRNPSRRWLIWLFLLLLVGLWFRLFFMLALVYHIDEFISMLAASMVARRGLPILPSGLFYDHGLLLSFLSGAFVALLGFREEIARWPVLLMSVFSIAAYYATASRLFGSRTTGLLAATLIAFDILSITWGVRARMYTPAHLFVLLSISLLVESMLKQSSRRGRYVFIVLLAGALFSHTITFLIVPPLAILFLVFARTYRSEWLRAPRLWQEALAALTMLAAAITVVALGQTGSTVSLQDANADAAPPLGLEFLRGFFLPGLEWNRFDDLVGFFQTPAYNLLFLAIIPVLLATIYRILRRRVTVRDLVFLFLVLFLALVIFEMGALLTDNWRKTRYLFMIGLPAFVLLAAESIAQVLRWLIYLGSTLSRKAPPLRWAEKSALLLGLALIAVLWVPGAWHTVHGQSTGDYNTAFEWVRERLQPGDKIMTVHPSAAYLFAGRSDFYANQSTAKVLDYEQDEDLPVDRYTGSSLIDSVGEFNTILAETPRLWFVIDSGRLHSRLEPFFTQQVFAQMDIAHQTGAVYTFVSRPYPVPLPAEPTAPLDGIFDDLIRLEGYALDPAAIAPDGTIPLGLYWRPTGIPTRSLKVFVQLRNGQGQIIAQADHFIYEGLLTGRAWADLQQQGEWLRDTADLQIPLPLPPAEGPYRVYVGLYDPDTFERVPVVNDTSGENAVVIDLALPGG
ncbi:MAG: ArnT family glycosyltransferase [Anaerolineae bacterium]